MTKQRMALFKPAGLAIEMADFKLLHKAKAAKDSLPENMVTNIRRMVGEFQLALTRYHEQCVEDSPGSDGLLRKETFVSLVRTLAAARNINEANLAFGNICNFYLRHENSGRLLENIRDAFINIFNIRIDCEELCKSHQAELKGIRRLSSAMNRYKARSQENFFYEINLRNLKNNTVKSFVAEQKQNYHWLHAAHAEFSHVMSSESIDAKMTPAPMILTEYLCQLAMPSLSR